MIITLKTQVHTTTVSREQEDIFFSINTIV